MTNSFFFQLDALAFVPQRPNNFRHLQFSKASHSCLQECWGGATLAGSGRLIACGSRIEEAFLIREPVSFNE